MFILYNNESNDIRVEIVPNREGTSLNNLIEKHECIGNNIVTDVLNCYSFLNSPASWYIHHNNIHSRNDFGSGLDTTIKIEGIWDNLKEILKKCINIFNQKI